MTHSLLAASVTSDCVSRETCWWEATYRHGAQVKDVPVILWLILRCGVTREVECGRRLLQMTNVEPSFLLKDSEEAEP